MKIDRSYFCEQLTNSIYVFILAGQFFKNSTVCPPVPKPLWMVLRFTSAPSFLILLLCLPFSHIYIPLELHKACSSWASNERHIGLPHSCRISALRYRITWPTTFAEAVPLPGSTATTNSCSITSRKRLLGSPSSISPHGMVKALHVYVYI